MNVKYGDYRIVMDNVVTYSVAQKVDKETNKPRYAIFFNHIGGGYKELIAFDNPDMARTMCDIIDEMGLTYINGIVYTVVDKATHKVYNQVDDSMHPENYYFETETILKLDALVTAFGWEKHVVTPK